MANSMLQQLFTEIKDTVISKIHGNKKEVALVLSCGGARGLVHIGAIEALEDRGYHIHSIREHPWEHSWPACMLPESWKITGNG